MNVDQAIEELMALKHRHPGAGSYEIADEDGEEVITRFYKSEVDTNFGEIPYVTFDTREWVFEREEEDDEDDDWLEDEDDE